METLGSKPTTPVELKAQIEAERRGAAFLVHRDGDGEQRIVTLADEAVWVGRRDTVGLCLAWDAQVSTVHAELEPSGGVWTLVDDGLSRNGSFVNGERVNGRRRLRDRDMLRFGRTVVLFRAPARGRPAAEHDDRRRPDARRGEPVRDPAQGAHRAVPPVQGRRHARDAGDEPADRRRDLPQRAGGQGPPARAVREVPASRTCRRTASARSSCIARSAAASSPTATSRPPEPMHDEPQIGAEIGGYRLESVIARGGMGVVYLAEDVRMGRTVALKILPGELAENERFRARFLHESRVAGAVNHPNVIPVYDAGESDGLLYISMRYVEGTDLRGLLRTDGPLDVQRAVSIISQAASALTATHQRGLIHRDVKPGEHAARPAHDRGRHRPPLPVGLRPRQEPRLAGRADEDRAVHGHGRLRRARADPRQGRRQAHGRLRAGLRPVRVPHRVAAVSPQGRLRDDHGPRQRRAAGRVRAAARRARRDRRRRRAGAGEGPRRPLRELRGDGRRAAPRGGRADRDDAGAADGARRAHGPLVEGLGVVRRRDRDAVGLARGAAGRRRDGGRLARRRDRRRRRHPRRLGRRGRRDGLGGRRSRRLRRARFAAPARARRLRPRPRRRAGSRRACCSPSWRWAASSRSPSSCSAAETTTSRPPRRPRRSPRRRRTPGPRRATARGARRRPRPRRASRSRPRSSAGRSRSSAGSSAGTRRRRPPRSRPTTRRSTRGTRRRRCRGRCIMRRRSATAASSSSSAGGSPRDRTSWRTPPARCWRCATGAGCACRPCAIRARRPPRRSSTTRSSSSAGRRTTRSCRRRRSSTARSGATPPRCRRRASISPPRPTAASSTPSAGASAGRTRTRRRSSATTRRPTAGRSSGTCRSRPAAWARRSSTAGSWRSAARARRRSSRTCSPTTSPPTAGRSSARCGPRATGSASPRSASTLYALDGARATGHTQSTNVAEALDLG